MELSSMAAARSSDQTADVGCSSGLKSSFPWERTHGQNPWACCCLAILHMLLLLTGYRLLHTQPIHYSYPASVSSDSSLGSSEPIGMNHADVENLQPNNQASKQKPGLTKHLRRATWFFKSSFFILLLSYPVQWQESTEEKQPTLPQKAGPQWN